MQSLNAKQFVKYLEQHCAKYADIQHQYDEIVDHCKNLLHQRLDLKMIQLLVQYTYNQLSTLKFTDKMLFSQFSHDFQQQMDQNSNMQKWIYEITCLIFYDMLYTIVMSLEEHTINYPISKKFIKVNISNYDAFCTNSVEIDNEQFNEKLQMIPMLISSLFLPQYFSHEQTRYLLVQISTINSFKQQLEQCMLLVPQLQVQKSKYSQFLGQLQEVTPQLITHTLKQIIKINQKQQFIQLIKPYLQLETYVFTQIIQEKINSVSPFIQRNCLLILEQLFPTTHAQMEIRAEINSIVNCIMSNYILVRQQAIITSGAIVCKYSDQLDNAQTQTLFDQIIVQCFDKCKKVRIAALQQVKYFFGINTLKVNIINSILQNIQIFKNLFGVNDKYTKNILIEIFLLIQQHMQENQNNQQMQRYELHFTTEFKEFLLKSLSTLGKQSLSLLFPDQIGTFINNPEFCYEQIYISAKSCPQFLNTCLSELIQSEFTPQIIYLSELYYYNLENNNLFDNYGNINDTIIEYVKNTQANKKLIGFASLIHVLFQIILNQLDINEYFYKFILQISQTVYFIHKIAKSDNLLYQQILDFNKFAFKSLSKQNIKILQDYLKNNTLLSTIIDEIIHIHQMLSSMSKHHKQTSSNKLNAIDSMSNVEYNLLKQIHYRFDVPSLKALIGSDLYCRIQTLIMQHQESDLFEEITELKEQLYQNIEEIQSSSDINLFTLQCKVCTMLFLNKSMEDIQNFIEGCINQIQVKSIELSQMQSFIFILGDIYQLTNSPHLNVFFEQLYSDINEKINNVNIINIIEMIKIGYQRLINVVLNKKKTNQQLIDIIKDNLEKDE